MQRVASSSCSSSGSRAAAAPSPLRSSRRPVRTAAASSDRSSARGPHAEGPVELPGGALWWQHLHTGATTPVYGPDFVMQRPTVGGPGLVRAVRPPKPVRQAPPAAQPPVVWHAPGAATGLALAGSSLSGVVVIDTDFQVVPSRGAVAPSAAIPPNTSCVGLVWQPSASGEEGAEEEAGAGRRRRSKHPRRTQMLRFTCNLCGEVNNCEVNPHAWSKGSVFARCGGCTAVHKLKDNLKIFHELSGPVFPPRHMRSAYLVQEIIDRITERNNNRN